MKAAPIFMVLLALVSGIEAQRRTASSEVTTFYFVRHGEGDRSDARMPLASRGLERAHRLARVMERVPLTHVFSSHTLRSIEAVEPTAKFHGLEVIELPALGSEVDGEVIHEVSPSDLAIGPLTAALREVTPSSTVLVGVNADNVFAIMNGLGVPLGTDGLPFELAQTYVPYL
jgi:hypothetical protein